MVTGELKNQVDQIWNTFRSGGVSNPLSVIEQITYLLFAKRLDDMHIAKEAQANLLGEDIKDPLFREDQQHLRWSRFKDFEPERKFNVFKDEVFPFIKELNGRAGTPYTKFMWGYSQILGTHQKGATMDQREENGQNKITPN